LKDNGEWVTEYLSYPLNALKVREGYQHAIPLDFSVPQTIVLYREYDQGYSELNEILEDDQECRIQRTSDGDLTVDCERFKFSAKKKTDTENLITNLKQILDEKLDRTLSLEDQEMERILMEIQK
jgi:hypothetical protein